MRVTGFGITPTDMKLGVVDARAISSLALACCTRPFERARARLAASWLPRPRRPRPTPGRARAGRRRRS